MSLGRKYDTRCGTCGSDLNSAWLRTMKAILHPCIERGMLEAIREHGPITQQNLSSAKKRIVGEVLTELHNLDSGLARTQILIERVDDGKQTDGSPA